MLEVPGYVHDEINQLGPKSPERRKDMKDIVEMKERPARPMIVVTDRDGNHWLCDEGINPKKSLEEQGCWQCGGEHFTFTRDD